ncbi:hypothetical protein [Micrococcus luteus]|uniref:hypothetical protein n=1 Tax=Micrococcus luteus TaxID=1270 RepID=UPI000A7BADA9|nr:hypothetical protein [Micrococcus luteus]MBN6749449.1 hypothetical protein [Micrococcus luteus]MBN6759447.1 hypothetical protein [Micrococcus luteus]MBN6800833.1 hypothetical protein [Micrococcus luteus]TKD53481.1 hypothetical protein FBF74_10830 [Micrococcus luteus]
MRTLRGLGALALLLAMLIGIPVALIALGGNPIPDPDALRQALTGVDYGGRVLMGTILPLIGWAAWASFAVSVVVELVAQARNVRAPQLKGLGAQQALAGGLVAAVLAIGGGAPAMAQDAPAASAGPGAGSASVSQVLDQPSSGADSTEQAGTYTVREGDTLAGIARTQLGDESRWGELAEDMQGVEQSDGRSLQDPNMIYTGWEVPLDGIAGAPAGQGSTAAPAEPDAGTTDTTGTASTNGTAGGSEVGGLNAADTMDRPGLEDAPAAAPAPAQAPTATDAQQQADAGTTERQTQDAQDSTAAEEAQDAATAAPAEQPEQDAEQPDQDKAPEPAPAVPGATYSEPVQEQSAPGPAAAEQAEAVDGADEIDWRTAGGIGAILAAGVLALIAARRAAQRRRRKPGQQVPRPAGEDAQIEAQLRTVADQPAVDELDLVLRAVALWASSEQITLPEMFCVRVTDEQIALYLAAPAAAELPAPFVREDEEGTVWTIESGQIEGLEQMPEAPYPALVTVGKDDTGAQLLLDLEYLGTLGLEGESQLVSEALDAMAVELATSAWGESLQVTLVGVAPGLASAVGTGRVRQVDDLDELLRMLAGRAEDVKAALDEAGVATVHEAKGTGIEQEWAPEIVLLGVDPTDAQADQLRELTRTIPRLGVAAVTTQNPLSAPWHLELVDQDNADLEPAGLHLTPQRITAAEAQRIIAVLATALADPEDTDASGTQTVDLAAILGRPATHLTIVPTAHDEDTAPWAAENTTETTELSSVPASVHDEDETDHGMEITNGPAEYDDYLTTAAEAAAETDQDEAAAETEPTTTTAQAAEELDHEADEDTTAAELAAASPAEDDQEPAALGADEDDQQDESAAAQAATEDDEQEPLEDTPKPEDDEDEDEQQDQPAAPEQDTVAAEAVTEEETEPAQDETDPATAAATVTRLSPKTQESELDRQAADLLEQVTPEVPLVSLLGPMRIVGARGEAPVSASTGKVSDQQAERCVALAAYLALHPGASAEAYHAAFWPNADPSGTTASSNRNKLAAQTRKYLGQEEDGTQFFPRASSDGYRLDPRVTTDWQILRSLISNDPTTVSTPALVAAMRLVRGAPFQHAKSKNVAWADDLHQEMVELICDAAHELVHRALSAGHHGHAQLAARVGRTVDPASEAMWRDAITAEAAAGNREEVSRLVEQLYTWLDEFEEGLEPEDETVELIDTLREHGYRVIA